ncbi:MAG: Bax inhibitor-1/YccA family protein [Alphaproteobacteria bacterium]
MEPWNRTQSEVQSQAMAAVDQGLRAHMLRVYNYMASGVLLTAIVSYFAGTSEAFLRLVIAVGPDGAATGMSPLGWIIAFAPLAMVLILGFRAHKMSAQGVQMAFWGYAVLMGLSLFSIFLVYTGASSLKVFFITAGTFGLLSMYGYTTKRDLTSWGTFLFVGIWAVLIVSLLNVFWFKASGLDLALSYVGVFLALGLTAYDTQKVKELYYTTGGSGEAAKKASILGALSLYFDFIYLFINLLRIMGERR